MMVMAEATAAVVVLVVLVVLMAMVVLVAMATVVAMPAAMTVMAEATTAVLMASMAAAPGKATVPAKVVTMPAEAAVRRELHWLPHGAHRAQAKRLSTSRGIKSHKERAPLWQHLRTPGHMKACSPGRLEAARWWRRPANRVVRWLGLRRWLRCQLRPRAGRCSG